VLLRPKYLDVVKINRWEFVRRKNITGIVGIVPVTDDGKLVLLEQFRPPMGGKVIELPAGLVGDIPGKQAEAAGSGGRRDARNRLRGRSYGSLVRRCVTPGLCDETITFFWRRDLSKRGRRRRRDGDIACMMFR
jgi:ADP-ribose pyrophosphatase